jgi:hypothetical protein
MIRNHNMPKEKKEKEKGKENNRQSFLAHLQVLSRKVKWLLSLSSVQHNAINNQNPMSVPPCLK